MSTWFANPWALWLLLVLPLLTLLAWLGRRQERRRLRRLGSPAALQALREGGRQWNGLRRLLVGTGLVFLIVAIAGPQWGLDPTAIATTGRDVVVLVDVSRSMLADDVVPSRLERTRQALAELADTVQQRGGHRLGLVAFAARPQVLCPLTADFDHFRQKIAELDPDALPRLRPGEHLPSGTRMGAGLREAVRTLDERFREGQSVLMISDGDDPADQNEWRGGISAARSAGVKVYTVGVGDPVTSRPLPVRFEGKPARSRLHEEPLRTIARQTGGSYTATRTGEMRLGELFREQIEPGPPRDVHDENIPVYRQRYAGFLAVAIGCLALALGIGPWKQWIVWRRPRNDESRGRILMMVRSLWPVPLAVALLSAAPALDPSELVRLGNAAFERGDYAAAVELYEQAELRTTDPGQVAFNKAAALFHLAETAPDPVFQRSFLRAAELHYRSCLDDLDPQRRVRALYGLGTCLLQQSQGDDIPLLDEAIAVLGRCLRMDPDPALAADVRHNRELARLLRLKAKPSLNKEEEPEPPERNGNTGNDSDPGTRPKNGTEPGDQLPNPMGQPVKPEKPSSDSVENPVEIDQQTPGAGNLPPVPDSAEKVPMTPADVLTHLQQAAERILRDRRAHLKQQAPPPGPGVQDW